MDISYYDYYEQYKSIHAAAERASAVASENLVSNQLSKMCSDKKNEFEQSRISQAGDSSIDTYNESLDMIVSKVEKINEFATSYKDVESVYVELNNELNKLKDLNTLFEEKSRQMPDSDDRKYIKPNTSPPKCDYDLYNEDLSMWEEEMSSMKTNCSDTADNIQRYLDYLKSINSFNPEEGSIKTSIPRPYQTEFCDEGLDKMNGQDLLPPYTLTGQELSDFLQENTNIPNEEWIKVVKNQVLVNGVVLDTYMIYDSDVDSEYDIKFQESFDKTMDYLGMIHPAILDKVYGLGSNHKMFFTETYRCDSWSLECGFIPAGAYCDPNDISITQYFDPNCEDDFYQTAVVHEFGHAYDFVSREELTGDRISSVTLLTENYSNEVISKCLNTDSNGNFITWDKIIADEAGYFDSSHSRNSATCKGNLQTYEAALEYYNTYCKSFCSDYSITLESDGTYMLWLTYQNIKDDSGVTYSNGFGSPYDRHEYVEWPIEYFADSFQAYWIGDATNDDPGMSKLEYLCPETYAALTTLFKQDIDNYGGKL